MSPLPLIALESALEAIRTEQLQLNQCQGCSQGSTEASNEDKPALYLGHITSVMVLLWHSIGKLLLIRRVDDWPATDDVVVVELIVI